MPGPVATVNRWLGRPPQSRDEVRRLQACCDGALQCQHCPFQPDNATRSLADITRSLMAEWQ